MRRIKIARKGVFYDILIEMRDKTVSIVRRRRKEPGTFRLWELLSTTLALPGRSTSFVSISGSQPIQNGADAFCRAWATFILISSNSQYPFPLKKYVLPKKSRKICKKYINRVLATRAANIKRSYRRSIGRPCQCCIRRPQTYTCPSDNRARRNSPTRRTWRRRKKIF